MEGEGGGFGGLSPPVWTETPKKEELNVAKEKGDLGVLLSSLVACGSAVGFGRLKTANHRLKNMVIFSTIQ